MRLLLLTTAPIILAACTPAPSEAQAAPSADVTGTMFVANKRGASLSRIDLGTGEETHRAETCENPHELAVSPDETRVLVACYSGRTLEIYSTDTLEQADVIEFGEGARVHAALWPQSDRIIAGGEGRGSLIQIAGYGTRSTSFIEMSNGAVGPHLLAVDLERNLAWGTIIPAGEVVLWDITPGGMYEIARARIGEAMEAIAVSPDGQNLWVSSNAESIAYRLDPMTLEVLAEVETGEVPIRLAMHPSGNYVVSSNFGSGDLTVIDTRTDEVVRTIPVSGSRDAVQVTLVFSEDGERLYAAETATDTIAEIDFASGEVLRRIATGPGGDGLAVID